MPYVRLLSVLAKRISETRRYGERRKKSSVERLKSPASRVFHIEPTYTPKFKQDRSHAVLSSVLSAGISERPMWER